MRTSKNIILIGGAPTTGKTTVAEQLSKELQIPWISTDQIRTVLKSVTDENRVPELFQAAPEEESVEQIIEWEIKKSEVIWQGVRAFIENYYPWNGCIIEGVAILPHLVKRDLSQKPEVQTLFLVHADIAKIAHLVAERSKLPFIKTKTEAQQESKVKQIELLNQRIKTDAESANFTVIEASTKQTFGNILKMLA